VSKGTGLLLKQQERRTEIAVIKVVRSVAGYTLYVYDHKTIKEIMEELDMYSK
jgi:hypothetical protein